MMIRIYFAIPLLVCFTIPAQAYIGPGMGGGVIVAMIGIVGSIFLALFGILYFPIKRMLKKRKANTAKAEQSMLNQEKNGE